MAIFDRRGMKQEAEQLLAASGTQARKLVLIHTAVSLGITALLTVINFILTRQIEGTGGLGGLGVRSILSTAQSVLELAAVIVLPFWQIGLIKSVLLLVRKEEAAPASLLEGLRRFFPVLRLNLLRGALYAGIGVFCIYFAAGIFMMTPWSAPLVAAMEPLMTQQNMAYDQMMTAMEAMQPAMDAAVLPLMLIFGGLFCLFAIPLMYRFRMADYLILDVPGTGALGALRHSARMMRRRRLQLFFLDLSFWWFYLLEILIAAVGYADAWLPALGVMLPLSGDVAFFLFFGVHLAGQLALYWWAKAKVALTYGIFYESLEQPPVIQPAPISTDWDQTA